MKLILSQALRIETRGAQLPFYFHGELLAKLSCDTTSALETLASLPRINL